VIPGPLILTVKVENTDTGRYAYATRDVSNGEIIETAEEAVRWLVQNNLWRELALPELQSS
jgi:hypothetical protein